MPELPDVETMRRYLETTALHQAIEDVEVHAAGLIPSDEAPQRKATRMEETLEGHSFTSTRRHGKYLFVALDDADECGFMVLHFGMTGGVTYFEAMDQEPEYDRVLFHFANGHHLAYHAMRKLGRVEVIDDVEGFIEQKGLGPDVLDAEFSLAAFEAIVDGRRAMVKAILMDQGTMAGIGNVYSDEILFQAGIHPRTKINALDGEALEELFHEMKDVLQEAISCEARPEEFPRDFLGPHRHPGGSCPICGAELERVKVSSRTAYYCPNRQRQKG